MKGNITGLDDDQGDWEEILKKPALSYQELLEKDRIQRQESRKRALSWMTYKLEKDEDIWNLENKLLELYNALKIGEFEEICDSLKKDGFEINTFPNEFDNYRLIEVRLLPPWIFDTEYRSENCWEELDNIDKPRQRIWYKSADDYIVGKDSFFEFLKPLIDFEINLRNYMSSFEKLHLHYYEASDRVLPDFYFDLNSLTEELREELSRPFPKEYTLYTKYYNKDSLGFPGPDTALSSKGIHYYFRGGKLRKVTNKAKIMWQEFEKRGLLISPKQRYEKDRLIPIYLPVTFNLLVNEITTDMDSYIAVNLSSLWGPGDTVSFKKFGTTFSKVIRAVEPALTQIFNSNRNKRNRIYADVFQKYQKLMVEVGSKEALEILGREKFVSPLTIKEWVHQYRLMVGKAKRKGQQRKRK